MPADGVGTAKIGEIVVAEIVEQPSEHREAVARVKEVLGSATDPGIEIEIALRKHSLPFEFSKEAQRQAKRLPTDVRAGRSRRAASTSPRCRWSRSTARPPRTSTTPSTASARAGISG